MVCDDSVAIRGAIVRMLESDPAIRVVARAVNGQAAVDELARTPVDVLVLDIEMPVLDGLAALPLLLRADPDLRVIMASTLTTRGADVAMRALRLGAADYVPKPSAIGAAGDATFRTELIEKVKGLARLRRRSAAAIVRVASRFGSGGRTQPAAGFAPAPGSPAAGAAAGDRQLDRRPAGAVHAGAGARADIAGPGGADPAHAENLHPDPGRAHHQAARPALRRGEAQRDAAAGAHLSCPGGPPSAGRTHRRRAAGTPDRRSAGEFLPSLGRSDAAQRHRRVRRTRCWWRC